MQSLSLLNQLGAKIDELIEKIKKQEEKVERFTPSKHHPECAK